MSYYIEELSKMDRSMLSRCHLCRLVCPAHAISTASKRFPVSDL